MRKNLVTASVLFLYGCATLQFVRFYAHSTYFYLKMNAYLNGQERLPFQERILPVFILKPMFASPWVRSHFHQNGSFTAERGPFYALSFVALAIAVIYTQRLYQALTESRTLQLLVFPVFLYTVTWTYVLHNEANFAYPYDFPSLAFFSAGLFYIYRRRFWPLFLILLVGTWNRETTLFLIGIYVLDSVSVPAFGRGVPAFRERFDLRKIPWLRAGLLTVTWLAIKLYLQHRFRANDPSESFIRIHYNLERAQLRLVPAMLNVCGYLLPLVLLLQRMLKPMRFRNYLLIVVPWVIVMIFSGVLIETRIYGELCPLTAVALVLIAEERERVEAEEAHVGASFAPAETDVLAVQ